MKQALGFAFLGGVVALLSTSIADLVARPTRRYSTFLSAGLTDDGLFGGQPYVTEVVVGVVAGTVIGVLARLCGVTTAGWPGNRIVRVVVAGLIGAGVGVGIAVWTAFGGVFDDAPGTAAILALYAACGLFAYVLSIGAVHVVLRVSGDAHVRATTLTLAWIVPVGAVLAIAAGVGVASLSDFSTDDATWVAVCTVVVCVVAATFAAGRAIGYARGSSAGQDPDTTPDITEIH